MYGCSKDCLFLIPIRLPQFSCFTLSLRCFSSDSDKCGGRTPASVPPPAQGRSSPTNTPGYPSSSFILLLFAWFCVFFSTGQVLLSALSWCSICPSACEGGFLMYPWREMNSTFTHSSAILFYPCQFNFLILTYYYYISQTFPSILTSRWHPLSFLFLPKRNHIHIYILLIIIMRMVEQPWEAWVYFAHLSKKSVLSLCCSMQDCIRVIYSLWRLIHLLKTWFLYKQSPRKAYSPYSQNHRAYF